MFYHRLAQQKLGHTNTLLLPDKIHAQESLIPISTLSAPHRFIPNTHLMLIGTHLCPPQPGRLAQHDCISVLDLLYLYVCALLTGGPRHRGVGWGQSVNGYPGSSAGEIEGCRAVTCCLCHLPPPSLLHSSLWQESTPPLVLHHRACQSFSQKRCAVPQWRGAEPRRCHRRRGASSSSDFYREKDLI